MSIDSITVPINNIKVAIRLIPFAKTNTLVEKLSSKVKICFMHVNNESIYIQKILKEIDTEIICIGTQNKETSRRKFQCFDRTKTDTINIVLHRIVYDVTMKIHIVETGDILMIRLDEIIDSIDAKCTLFEKNPAVLYDTFTVIDASTYWEWSSDDHYNYGNHDYMISMLYKYMSSFVRELKFGAKHICAWGFENWVEIQICEYIPEYVRDNIAIQLKTRLEKAYSWDLRGWWRTEFHVTTRDGDNNEHVMIKLICTIYKGATPHDHDHDLL